MNTLARLAGTRAGTFVWVTTNDGRQQSGRLTTASVDGLEIVGGGTKTMFSAAELRTVQKRDGVADGIVTGGLAGGLVGILPGLALRAYLNNEGSGGGEGLLIMIGLGAGIGAGVGVLADALHGRETIYERPVTPTIVHVAPIVGKRSVGVGVSMNW